MASVLTSSRMRVKNRLAAIERLSDAPRPRPLDLLVNPAPPHAGNFARLVEQCVEGGVLRYARRQRLIEVALRLGMDEFDASLLIASVLHRMTRQTEAQRGHGRRGRWLIGAITILLIQGLIVLGLWGMLR